MGLTASESVSGGEHCRCVGEDETGPKIDSELLHPLLSLSPVSLPLLSLPLLSLPLLSLSVLSLSLLSLPLTCPTSLIPPTPPLMPNLIPILIPSSTPVLTLIPYPDGSEKRLLGLVVEIGVEYKLSPSLPITTFLTTSLPIL